jgi:hypothetical protein
MAISPIWAAPKDWGSTVLASADMDTYVSNNLLFLKLNVAYGAPAALTVAAGVITKTQTYHKIAGEGAAADDVDTIAGGAEGEVLILRPNGNIITLKTGTGNLVLGSDIVLGTDDTYALLICNATGNWLPLVNPATPGGTVGSYGAAVPAVISAGGVLTRTGAYHAALDQNQIGDDDEITSISGGVEGDIIIIRPGSAGAIKLINGAGLVLGEDILLDGTNVYATLICDLSGNWTSLAKPTYLQIFNFNSFACPAPGTGWTPDIAGVTLPASQTAAKCWLPLSPLKSGDLVLDYTLLGDAVMVAALTLDCKLVLVEIADPIVPVNVTDGAMTQVVANGTFGEKILPASNYVGPGSQLCLEIVGTTGVGDSITVTGAQITILRR